MSNSGIDEDTIAIMVSGAASIATSPLTAVCHTEDSMAQSYRRTIITQLTQTPAVAHFPTSDLTSGTGG